MIRVGVFLLIITGLALFSDRIVIAKDPPVAIQETPAWESFGVQRFEEKKSPPAFSLKDLKGNMVSLTDLKGTPLLVFFWGTWCPACKEEISLLEKFYNTYTGELKLFTIVIDGESERTVKRIVRDQKITLPVLLDRKEQVARKFGVRMIPTAFFINRDGLMEGMVVGQRDWCGPNALLAMKTVLDLR